MGSHNLGFLGVQKVKLKEKGQESGSQVLEVLCQNVSGENYYYYIIIL